jgi:hypothetical protein
MVRLYWSLQAPVSFHILDYLFALVIWQLSLFINSDFYNTSILRDSISLNILQTLVNAILTIMMYHYFHFTSGESPVQRCQVTCFKLEN